MPRALLLIVPAFVTWTAVATAGQWPSFRGPAGTGVAADARPPVAWNVASSTNVVWRAALPGLGHSSPIVWGDRIYLTTAISDVPSARALVLGDSSAAGIDPASDHGV